MQIKGETMIYRIFVEKKDNLQAKKVAEDIRDLLKIEVKDVRLLIRYDVDKMNKTDLKSAISCVFSEQSLDDVYLEEVELPADYKVFAVAYADGQYDWRADGAVQCVQLLTLKERPVVRCATLYAIKGVNASQLAKIKKHIITADMEEVGLDKPSSLNRTTAKAEPVQPVQDFAELTEKQLEAFYAKSGLKMSLDDLKSVRDYFVKEGRNPTETELKVIDGFWSEKCSQKAFLTEITGVKVNSDNPHVNRALQNYKSLFSALYSSRSDKYPCLKDISTIAMRKLQSDGLLDNLDERDVNGACAINIDAIVDGKSQKYKVVFNGEICSHGTDSEPFGDASACLSSAIGNTLSGRVNALQVMRVSGCGDPTEAVEGTATGKPSQREVARTKACGFASYGNQVGIPTGQAEEVYHPDFKVNPVESCFVVGGANLANLCHSAPIEGDKVILVDDADATRNSDATVARKLQRLFLNPEATKIVKKCSACGESGIAVAIGELADGLNIELDKISQSQDGLAVVVAEENEEKFIKIVSEENLTATPVATVTDDGRIKMYQRGKAVVDLSREFLNTNGVRQRITAEITDNVTHFFDRTEVYDFKRSVARALMNLNVCSKKGLAEMFDSTVGAKSAYLPYGGKRQLTPAIAMVSKIEGGETDDCTVSSYGYNPDISLESPFTGAIYAIVTSVAKVVATGANYRDIRLSLQENFTRTQGDSKRLGAPLSAILGAFYAQVNLGVASVGSKYSVSGTSENIVAPPTLISYALAPSKASGLITNVLSRAGKKLYVLPMRKDKCAIPDFEYLKKLYFILHLNIESGNIKYATVIEKGGIVPTVIKSCIGNGLGFNFHGDAGYLFSEHYGDIIICADDISQIDSDLVRVLVGSTTDGGFTYGTESVSVAEATSYFSGKLASVFPTTAKSEGTAPNCDYTEGKKYSDITTKIAKPKVLIPVFPGTNGEMDMERAFRLAGAESQLLVFKNRTVTDIEESVQAIIKAIDSANIIAFPGGNEPCSSGKFVSTAFKNPVIAEKITELLNSRDGLILGIGNGFHALIKLGLVPYGTVAPLKETSPTITNNQIAHHVNSVVQVRVASNLSPWLSACSVGDIYSVPVSHGEGKLVANEEELKAMLAGGQIATQYVDLTGNPTMESPYNPSGSVWAIEGITSPDGRVFGKMGHSERIGKDLYKNYDGNFDMKIFESGVKYFK